MKALQMICVVLPVCFPLFMCGCKSGSDTTISALSVNDRLPHRSLEPAADPPAIEHAVVESVTADALAGNPGDETPELMEDAPEVVLTAARSQLPPPGPVLVNLQRGENLQELVERGHRRVVLDFYADWCGPCRRQAQVLHEFEPEAAKRNTLIVKINVDEHPALAESLRVKALPTLLVYGDGQVLHRNTGLADADQLTSWIR